MADATLSDRLPLSKRDGEARQQFADRLLQGRQANREKLDRLGLAEVDLGHIRGLSDAVLDAVEDIAGLVRPNGVRPDSNILHFINRASTLLSLQLDCGESAAAGSDVAVAGWPL